MTGRAQVIEFGVFGLCGDLLANSILKIPLESHEHYGFAVQPSPERVRVKALLASIDDGSPERKRGPPTMVPARRWFPPGTGWIHEIKHDGFRMLLRRDDPGLIRSRVERWAKNRPPKGKGGQVSEFR
jgi:hypothetical protein